MPADVAIRSIQPVVILLTQEQLLAMGSKHRAGWLLGSKDNRCIAREFCMIKFQHLMFVSNPSFQRSVIFESDPKGNLSHPALLRCLWLTVVCQPELQNTQAMANKNETQHTSWLWGFFQCISPIIRCCFCHYYLRSNFTPWS